MSYTAKMIRERQEQRKARIELLHRFAAKAAEIALLFLAGAVVGHWLKP
jgi:hypothetical protein